MLKCLFYFNKRSNRKQSAFIQALAYFRPQNTVDASSTWRPGTTTDNLHFLVYSPEMPVTEDGFHISWLKSLFPWYLQICLTNHIVDIGIVYQMKLSLFSHYKHSNIRSPSPRSPSDGIVQCHNCDLSSFLNCNDF